MNALQMPVVWHIGHRAHLLGCAVEPHENENTLAAIMECLLFQPHPHTKRNSCRMLEGEKNNIYTQCSRLTVVKIVTKFRKVLSSLADVNYPDQHINTLVKSITLRLYTTFVNKAIKKRTLTLCFVKSITS